MEIKDLALLLMIPILLIGILYFVSDNPITGNAVSAQNENEKLGTYSAMPSFRVKIDYSMDDYKGLNDKLKAAIDKCINSKSQDIKDCIRTETNKPEYNWNCNNGNADILYDFADKLKECINLKEKNVVCKFSMDKMENMNNNKLRIVLTNWYYPRIKAELYEGDDKVLGTEFIEAGKLTYADYQGKDGDGKQADAITIRLEYKDGNPAVTQMYAVSGKNTIKLSKVFLIYKSKNGIKFIDENFESLFRPPANELVGLPRMQGIKFCAKTGKKVAAYDSSDNSVKEREIIYKFAITLPNPVPKQVDSFEAKDNLKSENSALIAWKKDEQADIKSYSIYYSTKDFSDIKISDINKDADIKKTLISLDNSIEIDKIDLDNCMLRYFGKPCEYGDYNAPLAKNKLYYVKPENRFIYVLADDFKDGTDYNIAITSVNDKNEEIDNDKSIPNNKNILEKDKNYKTFASADDLAPGMVLDLAADNSAKGKVKLTWNLPAKNVDGTDNEDTYAFNVYYKDQALLLNALPGYEKVIGSIPKTSCNPSCEYTFNSLTPGRIYLFAVTAIDSDKNEHFADGGFATTTATVQ